MIVTKDSNLADEFVRFGEISTQTQYGPEAYKHAKSVMRMPALDHNELAMKAFVLSQYLPPRNCDLINQMTHTLCDDIIRLLLEERDKF